VGNRLAGVLATAVGGLSNVVVQLAVASLTSADQFGLFAIASFTVILLLGAGRAVIGQTDVLRGGSEQDPSPITAAYLVAMASAAVGGGISVAGTFLASELVVTIGWATALSSVFILQDGARFRCFRMQQSHIALISDSVVLVAALVGLFVAELLGVVAETALSIWAGATTLGLLVVLRRLRYWPNRSGWNWLTDHRDLVFPGLGEYGLQAGVPYLLNWLVIVLGGLDALAGYRLAQLLFAAVSNLAQGINAATLPTVVNSRDPKVARRGLRSEGAALLSVSVLLLLAILWFPDEWGTVLLGASWSEMAPFLWPAFLHGLANALLVANFSALRLLGFANYSFFVRIASSVASVALAAVGAALMGATGVAWGLAAVALGMYAVRSRKGSLELQRLIRAGKQITPATTRNERS
jgi:O-antigen/teichoic acid export membrane protein